MNSERSYTMMWQYLILLTAFTVIPAWSTKLEFPLKEGDPCPSMPSYPESTCKKNCSAMIEMHILRKTLTAKDVVQCNVVEELTCCPNHPPQDPSKPNQLSPPQLPGDTKSEPDPQKLYPHLASLRYLNSVTLDFYLYRCAALIVKENMVLTSAYCAGLDDILEMPNRVRLGLIPPFKEELGIGNSNYVYNRDLVMFPLTGNYGSEALAKICKQEDVDSSRKLVAVGFAQKNDANCEWFEQEMSLRPFNTCNVTITSEVKGVNSQTHFCVYPVNTPASKAGSCFRCFRASASVLHAVQADGRVCVAGIATPTGGKCYKTGNADLYFTSFINQAVLDFINESN
ncbi:uncharacterized protein LOC108109932 [Drosophila eugracilis]|uniref:uncharacterized protein LOC108109932 n=1 Tax=Drosophila eugracilis TaxID=29029 RepID=UPI0007E7BDDD|nr:uncharacterized protein LOC108109932 [Drosophila eugracilis]